MVFFPGSRSSVWFFAFLLLHEAEERKESIFIEGSSDSFFCFHEVEDVSKDGPRPGDEKEARK
jgi:hypothetical protein